MIESSIPLSEFRRAAQTIAPFLRKTHLLLSDYYSTLTGGEIYFKPENLQRTGSYKVRGALFKISQMSAAQKAKGLIAASAGNHAQGVAYAAQLEGISATIVMPENTPLLKINETKNHGANVVLSGSVFDEAYEHACQLAKTTGATLVHPFDDMQIATGQGTMVFEILEQLPEIDILIVPIGGGGLITGVSMLAKLLKPTIEIIGVEPSGAASMHAAIAAGCPVELQHVETIADGTAVKKVGTKTFAHAKNYIDRLVCVDDVELVDAFLTLIEKHKIVVENAGLLSVAALNKIDVTGKKVVSILSGGNIDVLTISQMIQRGLMLRNRVFTFSIFLSNKPGELVNISSIVANASGNVIKLDHNQFSSMDRFSQVELIVTVETFGDAHKNEIVKALIDAGYSIQIVNERSK
ncbi:MAG: threonine ammonia-lyase [Culicoidibacterales bacterium]